MMKMNAGLAGVVSLMLCGVAASEESAVSPVHVSIESQPLEDALNDFAKQTGYQVLFQSEMVLRHVAPRVDGALTPESALSALLMNSGLQYKFVNARTVTISTAESRTAIDKATDSLLLAQLNHSFVASDQEVGNKATVESSSGAASNISLEEIVVTARRREEKAQTVPIAITAFSQQQLQDNNVVTVEQLQFLVPSMSLFTTYTRDSASVAIRGQGGKNGVYAYLNEVPLPMRAGEIPGGSGLFFDLENLQALKGPQGTLFGRNSVGGALLLQSARPKDELSGRVQLGYGNYNNREIDAAVNLPVIHDKLLTRFAFNAIERDGYSHLQADPGHPNGVDPDDRNSWAARGTVSFIPGDRFQNDIIATFQKYHSHSSPEVLLAVNPNPVFDFNGDGIRETRITDPFPFLFPTLPDKLAQQQALGVRTHIPVDTTLISRGELLEVSNVTRVSITDNLTFKAILGYGRATTALTQDFDGTDLPILQNPIIPDDTVLTQYTEEVQLLGKSFAGRLDWTAGGFFLDAPEPARFTRTTSVTLTFPGEGGTKGGEASRAVFAQGTYDLSALLRGLKLTAGVRYTWDRFTASNYAGPVTNESLATSTHQKSQALTWTTGLDYQVMPDTLLYFASRRGYRPGGDNGVDQQTGERLPTFGPEYVTDFELGLKSDWRLGGLPVRTNAAVYYQDYSNIQGGEFRLVNNVFRGLTGNATAAHVWGAELEAEARVTEDLLLGLDFDNILLTYDRFGPGLNPEQLQLGRYFLRPRYKYGLKASYRLPIAPQAGDLSVQANWRWQDGGGSPNLNVGDEIPAFGLLNMSVNWDGMAGTHLDLSLYGSNVLNKTYAVGGIGAYELIGYRAAYFGEPRMYGVRLRYRFGE